MNRQKVRIPTGDSQQKVVEPDGRIENDMVYFCRVVADVDRLWSSHRWNGCDILGGRARWRVNQTAVHDRTTDAAPSSGSRRDNIGPERSCVGCVHVPLGVRIRTVGFVVCQNDIIGGGGRQSFNRLQGTQRVDCCGCRGRWRTARWCLGRL